MRHSAGRPQPQRRRVRPNRRAPPQQQKAPHCTAAAQPRQTAPSRQHSGRLGAAQRRAGMRAVHHDAASDAASGRPSGRATPRLAHCATRRSAPIRCTSFAPPCALLPSCKMRSRRKRDSRGRRAAIAGAIVGVANRAWWRQHQHRGPLLHPPRSWHGAPHSARCRSLPPAADGVASMHKSFDAHERPARGSGLVRAAGRTAS